MRSSGSSIATSSVETTQWEGNSCTADELLFFTCWTRSHVSSEGPYVCMTNPNNNDSIQDRVRSPFTFFRLREHEIFFRFGIGHIRRRWSMTIAVVNCQDSNICWSPCLALAKWPHLQTRKSNRERMRETIELLEDLSSSFELSSYFLSNSAESPVSPSVGPPQTSSTFRFRNLAKKLPKNLRSNVSTGPTLIGTNDLLLSKGGFSSPALSSLPPDVGWDARAR